MNFFCLIPLSRVATDDFNISKPAQEKDLVAGRWVRVGMEGVFLVFPETCFQVT